MQGERRGEGRAPRARPPVAAVPHPLPRHAAHAQLARGTVAQKGRRQTHRSVVVQRHHDSCAAAPGSGQDRRRELGEQVVDVDDVDLFATHERRHTRCCSARPDALRSGPEAISEAVDRRGDLPNDHVVAPVDQERGLIVHYPVLARHVAGEVPRMQNQDAHGAPTSAASPTRGRARAHRGAGSTAPSRARSWRARCPACAGTGRPAAGSTKTIVDELAARSRISEARAQDRDLLGVAEIHRSYVGARREAHDALDQIVDVTERPVCAPSPCTVIGSSCSAWTTKFGTARPSSRRIRGP